MSIIQSAYGALPRSQALGCTLAIPWTSHPVLLLWLPGRGPSFASSALQCGGEAQTLRGRVKARDPGTTQPRAQFVYGDGVTLVPVTARTCPLALDLKNPGPRGTMPLGPVIPGSLPRQSRQPPCLLRTGSVSPGPWEPLGSCILFPSPGTAAGPGVSTGLLGSGFPGRQGKAGPGERWLCWMFWVGRCPVCVLPLDSQDVGALTLTAPVPEGRGFQHSCVDRLALTGRSELGMF